MDLSKLSDKELLALNSSIDKTGTPDLSTLSDEELIAMHNQSNQQQEVAIPTSPKKKTWSEAWKEAENDTTPLSETKIGRGIIDGSKAAAPTVKSVASGIIGGIPDMVALPYNIAVAAFNALKNSDFAKNLDPSTKAMMESQGMFVGEPGSSDIPYAPSVVNAADKKIDEMTGGYTATPESQKNIQEGVRTATSVLAGGGAGKLASKVGAKGIEKIANTFGSTRKRDVLTSGIASAETNRALEEGSSFGGALFHGIGAGQLPFLARDLGRGLLKRGLSGVGVGQKQLKHDAIDAANRIGVDLPLVAATDSKLVDLANQFVSKTPVIGDRLTRRNTEVSNQFQKSFEEMADKVGQIKTEDVERRIKSLYKKADRLLSPKEVVMPKKMIDAANDIRAELVKTAYMAPETEDVVGIIDKFLKNATFNGKAGAPMPVQNLIGTKKNLNKVIKWDTDLGIKDMVRVLQRASLDDLKIAGNNNPTWKKAFNEAERTFEKTAKRENLERLLAGKIDEPISHEVQYNALAKRLNDRKYQKQFKNILGSAGHEKLKDFAKVSESLALATRNNPNPSGTATVAAMTGLIGGLASLAFNPLATLKTGGFAGVVGLGAALAASEALVNKKFLNLAIRFGKKPTEANAKTLQDSWSHLLKELYDQHNLPMLGHAANTAIKHSDKPSPQL